MSRATVRLIALAGSLLLSACTSALLIPAPGARVIAGAGSIAFEDMAGVHITVQANAWQGDDRVTNRVQPIRVTIENRSTSTIRVRYADFVLVGANGKRYPALPPFRVEGELLSPAMSMEMYPIMSPRFTYRGFFVAPYFSRIYPGIPVYSRAYVFYDPGYYAFWHADFVRAVKPSMEVLSLALPEGVIEPNGQVSGFLYFRTVDPKAAMITFRASLVAVHDGVAATGGAVLGEIAIPFTVQRVR